MGLDGARWIQGTSATGVILADQCCTKSNAPSGRKSSAGAFHPRVFLGLVLLRTQLDDILDRARNDESFGKRLNSDPEGTLREAGFYSRAIGEVSDRSEERRV